jgi:DNA helicase II / ATP-dependent DNA helicase PcrA
VKDILSYLRVAYNVQDEVSWSRILLAFPGIGPKSASDILQEVVHQRKGLEIDEKVFEKKSQLRQLFTVLKKVDAVHQPPVELLKTFLTVYQPIFMEQYDDYDRRISDLESLERIISRYDSLEQFLADMTLDPLEKTVVNRQKEGRSDNLIISTIHSAKGLEWHTVFVIYVAEGYLPSYRSFNNEQAIEEERRLFYVATTRAKENLFLLRPQIDNSPRAMMDGSGSMYTRVSRFLEEGNILRKFVRIESDYRGTTTAWNSF